MDDKVNSLGAGGTITVIPSKLALNFFARWQE